MHSLPRLCAGLTSLAFLTLALTPAMAQEAPAGYRQLLPRGRIAAIDRPQYVGADKAEIPNDAWVMGVVIEGQARAYSITLLNTHEIVNDKIGDTPFAAVW